MEFYQAAVLCGAVVLIVVLTSRAQLPFFLALVLGSLFFALLSRMSLPSIGDTFSLGFAQTIDSFGLFIIAGCATAAFLERSSAISRRRSGAQARHRDSAIIAVGLVASLTPSATIALALLKPWCVAASGADAPLRARTVTTLALALSAGQAFLYPSLYVVATQAILKTDLLPMLGMGLVFAILTAIAGSVFVSWMTPHVVADTPQVNTATENRDPTTGLAGLIVPVLLPLLFLIAATFAQIPSEPLGRSAKEFFVFMARPTIVLTLSLGLCLLMLKRWDKAVTSEDGWLGAALTASLRPLLAVGAAGGLMSVIQATGMAELLAERISFLHLGIFIPFAVAAALKVLQGSPLVATLTAAGMTEPLLAALGLGGAWGHVLAALAIGAGTLIVHVNDPYFWLVTDHAALKPAPALLLYSLATLVQAAGALLLLLILGGLLL
jgi:GntP family gluconate:H+ symporter